jgi:hypothetical protein
MVKNEHDISRGGIEWQKRTPVSRTGKNQYVLPGIVYISLHRGTEGPSSQSRKTSALSSKRVHFRVHPYL